MLGNGVTGETIWGSGNILNITVGCANLWDHRGGMPWTPKQNYPDIRHAIETDDQDKITEIFAATQVGNICRPSLIPVGRLVITLPESAQLLRYEQLLDEGKTLIWYSCDGKEDCLQFYADMSMQDAIAGAALPTDATLELIPSWRLCTNNYKRFQCSMEDSLQERDFQPPTECAAANRAFFVQEMPADENFALICQRNDGAFTLSLQRNITADAAAQLPLRSFPDIQASAQEWWLQYWREVPTIRHSDSTIEKLYWHGLYKYGIMTNPAGVSPGLQGPWLEDDRLPPWQGDYHLNINAQLCNAPGLRAGKFAHQKQFFDLILSWKEHLRHNARCFAGISDGYMLPHAVDDHCVCMGGFWSGVIDHACAAWVAMMMFDYCDYAGDLEYLRTQVYDFMQGTMRVFQVMLEEQPDGTLQLPLSVSPEYKAKSGRQWGRNSSFQLAAIHRLAANLLRAADMLGEAPDPFWRKVREKLPMASVSHTLLAEHSAESQVIALWDGLALEESHRHHSHLGGLAPFATIDPEAPQWQDVVQNSMEQWLELGMGQWTGWCMPWAAQLATRVANGDLANLLLSLWDKVFTTTGGGSLHDGRFHALTIYSQFRGEVMQMDGAMGVVVAIQEQYLHNQDGVLKAFYGTPATAADLQFHRMFAPGGLLVSGQKSSHAPTTLTIEATRPTTLRIKLPTTTIFTAPLAPNEVLHLTEVNGELQRQ